MLNALCMNFSKTFNMKNQCSEDVLRDEMRNGPRYINWMMALTQIHELHIRISIYTDIYK